MNAIIGAMINSEQGCTHVAKAPGSNLVGKEEKKRGKVQTPSTGKACHGLTSCQSELVGKAGAFGNCDDDDDDE